MLPRDLLINVVSQHLAPVEVYFLAQTCKAIFEGGGDGNLSDHTRMMRRALSVGLIGVGNSVKEDGAPQSLGHESCRTCVGLLDG